MQSRLLALGLFSAVAIHPALAQQAGPAPGEQPQILALQDDPDQGTPDQGPWPHRPTWHGPEGFGLHRMGPPPQLLAARLAALETRIGVRSEQLDAWRDYTSALQAVLAPPGPDHGFGGSGGRGPDGSGAEDHGGKADQGPRDPFAFQERLADDVTKRGAAAAKLKDAIAALRTKLTPEQLEILASAEPPHGPPPGPWGHPPDAAGPGGLPGHDRHAPNALPRTDEQL
ncbi:hypothetical protein [Mesorhizobium neociceri]|uniref:LTXXQ motif family protein n=1 Tax=Mesorhizobium neociceri TaxID=1307853 RepID=A0A838BCJ9_9HYPH|nr:hypothetical protein [Mesorhizobium neociceri]MBA1144296.1 hypothetical protein [Mesorhizobium neociceri]